MGINRREIEGAKITFPGNSSFGLINRVFEEKAKSDERNAYRKDFDTFIKDKLKAGEIKATYNDNYESKVIYLPFISWYIPLDYKNGKKDLADIIFYIRQFVFYKFDEYKEVRIVFTIIAQDSITKKIMRVDFDGKGKNLNKLKLAKFYPDPKTFLNAGSITSAFVIPFILASALIISERGDKDGVFDFLSYTLPMIAGIIGAAGLFFPRWQTPLFWVSFLSLCLGLACYLISKHVDNRLTVAFILLTLMTLLPILLLDEWVNFYKTNKNFNLIRPLIMVAAILGILSSTYLIFHIRQDAPAHGCRISVNNPAKISIKREPNEENKNQNEGALSSFSLDSGVIINLNPCPF